MSIDVLFLFSSFLFIFKQQFYKELSDIAMFDILLLQLKVNGCRGPLGSRLNYVNGGRIKLRFHLHPKNCPCPLCITFTFLS